MQVVDRLESLNPPNEPEKEETVVVPVDENEESAEQLDDAALPDDKKNWDGETVAEDGEWGSQEAFSLGGVSVTNEEAAAGVGATVIVIIVLVVICCVISFIERKKIKEEADKVHTIVRQSMRRMTGAEDPDKDDGEAKAPKTEAEIKQMAG